MDMYCVILPKFYRLTQLQKIKKLEEICERFIKKDYILKYQNEVIIF